MSSSTQDAGASRGRWNLRLSTVLLLLTAATVSVAYYQSRAKRVVAAELLRRMQIAAGIPPILDESQFQLDEVDQVWYLWVPPGRKCEVRYAFHLASDGSFPENFEMVELEAGRHKLELQWQYRAGSMRTYPVRLAIGSETVLDRATGREWNVSHELERFAGVEQFSKWAGEITLLKLGGTVRLAVDESYDAERHSFGLHLWISQRSE